MSDIETICYREVKSVVALVADGIYDENVVDDIPICKQCYVRHYTRDMADPMYELRTSPSTVSQISISYTRLDCNYFPTWGRN